MTAVVDAAGLLAALRATPGADSIFAKVPGSKAAIIYTEAIAELHQISKLFDAGDTEAAGERRKQELEDLGAVVDTTAARVPALEAAATEALAAYRTAEDKSRSAAETARKATAAAEDARQQEWSDEACIEALKDRDKAAELLSWRETGLTAARAAHDQAGARLAEGRQAERAAVTAYHERETATLPVPMSAYTLFFDGVMRLLGGGPRPLTDAERDQVRGFIVLFAQHCGADEVFRADERRKMREQRERELAGRPLVASGTQTAVWPVQSRS